MSSVQVQLKLDKQTEQKYRWQVKLDDASFALYVPKDQVPDPVPREIRVTISSIADGATISFGPTSGLAVLVHRFDEVANSVRYRP